MAPSAFWPLTTRFRRGSVLAIRHCQAYGPGDIFKACNDAASLAEQRERGRGNHHCSTASCRSHLRIFAHALDISRRPLALRITLTACLSLTSGWSQKPAVIQGRPVAPWAAGVAMGGISDARAKHPAAVDSLVSRLFLSPASKGNLRDQGVCCQHPDTSEVHSAVLSSRAAARSKNCMAGRFHGVK